jgi:adenylate kinase
MSLNVVMYGPPGAGKGTQASRLAGERRIPRISTGNILREAVHANTEFGRRAKSTLDAGDLVRDDVMVGIVHERVARPDAADGFVLDGFPRTVVQATALDDILSGREPLAVIELAVPDDELVGRLSRRRVCAVCDAIFGVDDAEIPATCPPCGGPLSQRSDDREDVVRERLRVYYQRTSPVLAFYKGRPRFRSVNGNLTPDVVAAAIRVAIDETNGVHP